MKKTTKIAVATSLVAVLALNGCGSSSTSDAPTSGAYYDFFVPLETNPTTYTCAEENTELYNELDSNKSLFNVYYYTSMDECEKEAQIWLDTINKDDAVNTQEQQDALDYINDIREHIGLPIFHNNAKLQQATLNHENYLNDVWDTYGKNLTHYEDNENYPSDYYTGDKGTDRAKYEGYQGYYAGDVISYQNNNIISSMKVLMTAIYHRQALLWNNTNEIGIGGTKNDFAFPHLMGKKYDRVGFLANLSTDIVIYPYDGQTNVQTTFIAHSEYPDPMPDVDDDMGNPISVSFNSSKVVTSSIDMTSFKIYYDNNDSEITDTRVLDVDSDPNERFHQGDYALYALSPFDNNTTYRVEFKYTQDGVEKEKVWRFTTEE